jgi:HK97 family phage major capsid protein
VAQIDLLEARQTELQSNIKSILDKAEAESRGISDEEQTEIAGHHAEIRSAGEKITMLAAVNADQAVNEARRASQQLAPIPAAPIVVPEAPAYAEQRSEPYRKGGTESYFLDLYYAENRNDPMARERLGRASAFRTDMEKRAGATTVAGAGGELAPPAWLENELVGLLRPGRVLADRTNRKQLPSGVSSINLPKIATGTNVGAQSTQNTAITQQDIATTSVSTGITTVAGGALVSLQLLQQSPISVDDVILGDLAKVLAVAIDSAVITGISATSGINAITYTDGTPTSLKVLHQIQQAIDTVSVNVFEAPDAIVMRPERWGHFIDSVDGANRPMVLPSASYGPQSVQGMAAGQVAQGFAGTLRGIPVFLDPNIPANLGAGTNQDEIFVLKASEIYLYESAPTFATFEQTYANTLSLYIRAHEFYGLIANRYPKAVSLITGTGMIPQAYGV